MPQPCEQEGAIGKLEATTEQIGKTLERLLDVLEQVAKQGTRIEHLSEGQNLLFTRVRDMEISSESQKTKVGLIMAAITIIVSAVTAFITGHFK